MKLAVIATGGKQYVVSEQSKIKIEKIEGEVGDSVKLKTLLTADGDKVTVGTPDVGELTATIVRHARARKVTGTKYKPKTRQSKTFGHRQHFTEVEIGTI